MPLYVTPPRVWARTTDFFEDKGSGVLNPPYTKLSKPPVAIAAQDHFGAGVDRDVWTTPSKKPNPAGAASEKNTTACVVMSHVVS